MTEMTERMVDVIDDTGSPTAYALEELRSLEHRYIPGMKKRRNSHRRVLDEMGLTAADVLDRLVQVVEAAPTEDQEVARAQAMIFARWYVDRLSIADVSAETGRSPTSARNLIAELADALMFETGPRPYNVEAAMALVEPPIALHALGALAFRNAGSEQPASRQAPTLDQLAAMMARSGITQAVDIAGAIQDLTWQDLSLCAQTDPDLFFPEKGGSTKNALRVCGDCEVAGECLANALYNKETHGIFGGKTARERRKLLKGVGVKTE